MLNEQPRNVNDVDKEPTSQVVAALCGGRQIQSMGKFSRLLHWVLPLLY